MRWQDEIKLGMEMIMRGCKHNPEWRECHASCPFDKLCTSIYLDDEHDFSSPDTWEEEGIWD